MNEEVIDADVVVAGGGLAGTFAAIAAARWGARTVLVHDRSILGGNASSEIGIGLAGADCSGNTFMRYVREGGLVAEYAAELLNRSADYWSSLPWRSVLLWEMVRREPNLTLLMNASVRSADCRPDGAIAGVRVCQTTTERDYRITGRYFIDCTGHGSMAVAAGASFRMGREGRDEFGERQAPEQPDGKTMGATILLFAKNMGRPIPFIAPEWAAKFPRDGDLPFRHADLICSADKEGTGDEISGYWWLEYGGVKHTVNDAEHIRDEHLRILYGIWDHMKNTGDHGVANHAITHITPLPAHRESRRLMGDYILREQDVVGGVRFADGVAHGGWGTDLHPPEGIYSPEPPCAMQCVVSPYSIPFRSLYSVNVPNLLFAGRNVSVSHVALGSVRVMATCAAMGQAVGTAAALALCEGVMPRELANRHIDILQQRLLRDDCYIPGVRNTDPADHARAAVVTASSAAAWNADTVDGWMELAPGVAQIFPVSDAHLDTMWLYLKSDRDTPARIPVELFSAESINDFGSTRSLGVFEATVPPHTETWLEFPLRHVTAGPNRFCRVVLGNLPGVHWAYGERSVLGVNRAAKYDRRYVPAGTPEWAAFGRNARREPGTRGAFCMRLSPEPHPYGAANLASGVSRPDDWTNIWVSEPCLPQWVCLDFGRMIPVRTVQIVFDDDLDTNIYHEAPFGTLGQGMRPSLVREYRILAKAGDAWQELAHVRDNVHRRRVHAVSGVEASAIRIECLATHGAPEARIYEVRVY